MTNNGEELTFMEKECLKYYSHGLNYKEISNKLHLQYCTVKTYIRFARIKLGARHKGHAVYLYTINFDDTGTITSA